MTRMRAMFIIALGSGLLACATAPRQAEVISLPPARMVLEGFSFLPLAEEGWMIGGRSDSRIVLGKYGTHLDESFVISVTRVSEKGVATHERLREYVKREAAIDPKDKRYQNRRQEFSTASVGGALCVVQEEEAEDYGALTRSGRPDPMIQQLRQIVCAHPTTMDTLVCIGFSHRHYAEDRDPAFLTKSQSLFDSIEFPHP